jgi:Holliday junction resolvasome RuvABC endonuclease subunit
MSRAYANDIRVLTIDPSTRGFGFAVLEGPDRLIDWGVKETKIDKKRRSLKLIEDLIDRYQPNAIVLEDYAGKGSRRCSRIQGLIDEISKLALNNNVKVRRFSRTNLKRAFSESGARNKYEMAIAIAKRFPRICPAPPALQKTLDE